MSRASGQTRARPCGTGAWAVLALGLALLGGPQAARADIWGYVDERGIAHFASEKLDARYELYLRTGPGAALDTPGTADSGEPTPRAVAVPTAPAKLLAYFEVSTSYKSVKHLLRGASQRYNLDYELLKALIATESGFDAQAVSPKGAIGLMQVIPDTAARYGVAGDRHTPIERKLADPATNINAGSQYLRYLINLFRGRLDLALAAYNAGEGAVQRAGNRIPNYPETQNYVRTVMQLYEALKPPVAVVEQRRQVTPQRMREAPRLPPGGALGRGNMVPPLGSPGTPQLALPGATPPALPAATMPASTPAPASASAAAPAAAPAPAPVVAQPAPVFKIERD